MLFSDFNSPIGFYRAKDFADFGQNIEEYEETVVERYSILNLSCYELYIQNYGKEWYQGEIFTEKEYLYLIKYYYSTKSVRIPVILNRL
jgi:hypothetical protein